jgi:hypothetical protein|tara:strand:+ start:163 stop:528 length:366 start_codon:yes stop_codon:yes gene_type:complete
MREDIIGGLKNALDRGETIEQAIRTFVNAGYNLTEVREASQYATEGTLASLTHPVEKKEVEQKKHLKKLETVVPNKKTKSKHKISWKVYFLVSLLFVLVGVLTLTLFYRESVMDFLKNIFN